MITPGNSVIVDVFPPKNFGAGNFGEAEISALFASMLYNAGYDGRFTVRAEELIRGAPAKANSVRFQSRPVGTSGMFMLHVNWQGLKPVAAYKGVLISGEHEPVTMHEVLSEAYPTQTFVLARDGARRDRELAKPSHIFDDEAKFKTLASKICDVAEKDSDCFVTRRNIDDIVIPAFPKIKFDPETGATMFLAGRGYVSIFDLPERGKQQRFFVEPALFDIVGRQHPDKMKDTKLPVAVISDSPSAITGMGALHFLRELKALRKKLEDTEGVEDEIRILRAQRKALEIEAAHTHKKLETIQSQLEQKQKQLDDPELAEARETLAEFDALLRK